MLSLVWFQNIHMKNFEFTIEKQQKNPKDKLKAGKERNKHSYIQKRKNSPSASYLEVLVVTLSKSK